MRPTSRQLAVLVVVLAVAFVAVWYFAARRGAVGDHEMEAREVRATMSAAPARKTSSDETDRAESAESAESAEKVETVVVLHGLIRTSSSMEGLAQDLAADGYRVINVDYPSTEKTLGELVSSLDTTLDECCLPETHPGGERLHFVTHSLGGLLVRRLAADPQTRPDHLGRVVMISPPNSGSELADLFLDNPIYQEVMGPAGQELVTDPERGPASLGPVDFDLGVITGDATVNPLTSTLIPGPDDGKVSVASAKIEGMRDFLVVPHSHTWIMASDEVSRQVRLFLSEGRFDHSESESESEAEAESEAGSESDSEPDSEPDTSPQTGDEI